MGIGSLALNSITPFYLCFFPWANLYGHVTTKLVLIFALSVVFDFSSQQKELNVGLTSKNLLQN